MQPDSGSCLLLSANLLLFATVRIQATPVDAFGAIACALQLVRSTDLSAQTSTLDASADCPSAYFPRKSTRQCPAVLSPMSIGRLSVRLALSSSYSSRFWSPAARGDR